MQPVAKSLKLLPLYASRRGDVFIRPIIARVSHQRAVARLQRHIPALFMLVFRRMAGDGASDIWFDDAARLRDKTVSPAVVRL